MNFKITLLVKLFKYRCKITLNSATQWGRVTCAFRQGNYLVTGKHGVENSFS